MADAEKELGGKAAETTVALNPIVGVRKEELVKSIGVLLKHTSAQPRLMQKHMTAYGKDLLDIATGKSELGVDPRDRRFQDKTWEQNPFYKAGLQSWLAMQKGLTGWVEDTELSALEKARAQFVLNMVVDALAPTNSLVGNPSALKKFVETGGTSVIRGLKNAYDDLIHNKGMPSQVDGRPFKVGENLATSEGAVIFRNDMLELIQYKPLTEEVHETPFLSVPPQINKFYVNDLSPEKSPFRFLLQNGIQIFAVSWRNPTKENADWGLADYINSLVEAIAVVKKVSRQKKINIAGACSGGITVATLLNHLAAKGDDSVNALTLQVAVLDPQNDDSELGMFVSDEAIAMARKSSAKKGILAGDDLSRMFAWLRPNDLIWNYVVNNYLHGEDPPPFDILYWNNDSTNLPAKLHSDYLSLYEQSPYANPGTVEFMGDMLDLSTVTQDAFLVGGTTDHITPWRACYRTTQMLGGNVEFILSRSGHIQALLNPPGNPKSKYFTNPNLVEDPDDWFAGAETVEGTWWLRWAEWLKERSGEMKKPSKSLGNKAHPPTDSAPGTYVFD